MLDRVLSLFYWRLQRDYVQPDRLPRLRSGQGYLTCEWWLI
jgi:hypothetical protein